MRTVTVAFSRGKRVPLVRRLDGEFPPRSFDEMMAQIDLAQGRFAESCDKARAPQLWQTVDGARQRGPTIS